MDINVFRFMALAVEQMKNKTIAKAKSCFIE